MIVRKYKKRDVPLMRELFYETVHTVCKKEYTQEELEAWAPKERKNTKWRPYGAVTYVAEQEGKLIAFGDMERDGYINRLYTHKDYQGQGAGTAIMKALLQTAKKWKLPYVKLDASKTALGFYQKLGFLDAGVVTRQRGAVVFENRKMVKFL